MTPVFRFTETTYRSLQHMYRLPLVLSTSAENQQIVVLLTAACIPTCCGKLQKRLWIFQRSIPAVGRWGQQQDSEQDAHQVLEQSSFYPMMKLFWTKNFKGLDWCVDIRQAKTLLKFLLLQVVIRSGLVGNTYPRWDDHQSSFEISKDHEITHKKKQDSKLLAMSDWCMTMICKCKQQTGRPFKLHPHQEKWTESSLIVRVGVCVFWRWRSVLCSL